MCNVDMNYTSCLSASVIVFPRLWVAHVVVCYLSLPCFMLLQLYNVLLYVGQKLTNCLVRLVGFEQKLKQ